MRRGAHEQGGFSEIRVAVSFVPHGVLYGPVLLATVLQNEGVEVEVLECAFRSSQRRLLRRLLAEAPAVICVSTTFYMDAPALAENLAMVRELSPGSKIVLGGPSLNWSREMRALADYCVMGEGEQVIVPLVKALLAGEDPAALPGVGVVDPSGQWRENPALPLMEMDRNPTPDWSLLKRESSDFYMLATQRGCKWRCAFCTYPASEGWKLRYRSVDGIIEELVRNYERFGIRRYMFADSTFTHPVDRCEDLLGRIARLPFRVEWMAYARVDNIRPSLARLMAESGCAGVFLGIESGHDAVLGRMKKGFNTAQIMAGVALLREHRIPITASWVVGFPGETAETALATQEMLLRVGADFNTINTFALYEQSPLGHRPEQFGIEGAGHVWRHATMDSVAAGHYSNQIYNAAMEADLGMGSLFDLIHMSSIGYSPAEAGAFFRKVKKVEHGDLTLLPGLRPELDEIYRKARRHPIFSPGPSPLARPQGLGDGLEPAQRGAAVNRDRLPGEEAGVVGAK